MPRRPRSNSGGNTKKPPTAALQVVKPAEVVVLEEHRDLVSAVVAGAPWLQPSDRILVEQLRLLVVLLLLLMSLLLNLLQFLQLLLLP